ncbi:AraC family transcriptional regulator [Mucilaginibacter terrenus]|uniref:AraC family transcriptional regulator n=1 Tax=Mucilaginibacter terrenus TaxID=2482727 RepID=A0A3E2NQ41_9SPHI|nr:AraC family transcriptional regulator [Mucilaginibacter terrenus]RFZ83083.1 AraC family transcriptional regulator [Mucilaginibacter terrenus]
MTKLPQNLFGENAGDLSVYNYDIKDIMNRSKVTIDQYVISFLIQGQKDIYDAGSAIHLDNTKALMIAQGNYLMTEKCYGSENYKSILIFFSKAKLTNLLLKKELISPPVKGPNPPTPYFTVEQDDFVKAFINSLSVHFKLHRALSQELLEVKFEEIMIYLLDRYKDTMRPFLLNTLQNDSDLSFKNTIEANKYTNLRTEELAFLCNMSLSTFKRHFIEVFGKTPGNWFKTKRLERSKQLLASGKTKPSELANSSGYKNLSHFSTAYKAQFGKSPSQVIED